MDAKKCDRCGEYFIMDKLFDANKPVKLAIMGRDTYRSFDLCTKMGVSGYRMFDLCPKCMHGVSKYLKSGDDHDC